MDQAKRPKQSPQQDRRNRYLAMLSHDLKSALTGVIGGLRQIEISKLDENDVKHRDGALASAIEASRLLDGILDIEAIEAGRFELNVETTNIQNFLSELHRRWTPRADWKNITLKIFIDTPLPETVELDRGRLSRVLGNLIDNAIKYTENGSIDLSVQLINETRLDFTIRDDGPGFSEEALDNLFEFHGRPESASKPGSGLGLYISQSLVQQMDGEIRIKNHPKGGAEAVVTTPLNGKLRVDSELQATASVSVLPTTKLPDLSGLHILLAEDNMTNQLVVTQMLDAMGAKFAVASDGVEALAKFEAQEFDILLLDIEMPRMSGLDVMRSVRARNDKRKDQTIIALTAYAMREHRERIGNAGADALIAKPILGIEDFGMDILNTYQKTNGTPPDTSKSPGAFSGDTLIDADTFNALENSIGSDTMKELMSRVQEDLVSVRNGIVAGLETSDERSVASSSHVLISVAGAIGALATQKEAQLLNKASHTEDWSVIKIHSSTCLTKIEELLKFAESRLNL